MGVGEKKMKRCVWLGALVLSFGLSSSACRWLPELNQEEAAKTSSAEVESTPVPPVWIEARDGSRRTLPLAVAVGEAHEAPDVALDGQDALWMAWVTFPDGVERIAIQRISTPEVVKQVSAGQSFPKVMQTTAALNQSLGPVLTVGAGSGATGWPRLAARQNRVWVVWSEEQEGIFRVRIAGLVDGVLDGIGEVSDGKFPAVRPVLALDGEGIPWVAWEELREDRIVVQIRQIAGNTEPFTLDDTGELNQRLSLVSLPSGGLAVAWDHYEAGAYDLRLRQLQADKWSPIQPLTRDFALDQAPSLQVSPTGALWIAWHTDRRRSEVGSRLGRGLLLAQVEPGGLRFPLAGAPPELPSLPEKPAYEDALEFPVLRFDQTGSPHLFARRGQGYLHLQLGEQGWAAPVDLSEPGWGGRGRELRAVLDRTGTFHLAARWLHRLGYALLQPAQGSPLTLALQETPLLLSDPGGRQGAGRVTASQLEPIYRAGLTAGVRWAASPLEGAGTARRGRAGLAKRVPRRLPNKTPPLDAPAATLATPTPEEQPVLRPPPSIPGLPPGMLRWRQGGPGVRLYFGDLHTHTWVSDGTGDPDEIFTRARDLLHHDFVALTDHDVSNGNRYAAHEWKYAQLLSNFFNRDGAFTTLIAYEWTSQPVAKGGYGHRNLYFAGEQAPLWGVDKEAPDSKTLFELLKSQAAFAVPHHTSWTGTDWDPVTSELQPLFEVVSVHGSSEREGGAPIAPRVGEGGSYALEALQRGAKFGFVGGSDGHGVPWHYGVSRQEDVWTTGLTGVFARRLSRPVLHDALKKRLCYATSGPPLGLWLDANGVPMGETLQAQQPVAVRVRVQALAPTQRIELLRNGQPIADFKLEEIGGFAQGVYMEASNGKTGTDFYYVRITREDGVMAWSSPLWIEWNRITGSSEQP